MTTWKRPSGTTIELADTENMTTYAEKNGWVKDDAAPEVTEIQDDLIGMDKELLEAYAIENCGGMEFHRLAKVPSMRKKIRAYLKANADG